MEIMMKKYVFALLCCLIPSVMMTGFALSIDLSLFKGGLSILDSLFLIAMGLMLIGILFLCIAFLKPEKPLPSEEPEELEDAAALPLSEPAGGESEPAVEEAEAEAETAGEEEETDVERDQAAASGSETESQTGEQTEPAEADEPSSDEAAEAVETETDAEGQAMPEPEAEAEPDEDKTYPKLTLTGINNSEFKVLPLKDDCLLYTSPSPRD